jgi:hypothetical protein
MEEFISCLKRGREKHTNKLSISSEETKTTYWKNYIISVESLMEIISFVFNRERDNGRSVIKCSITYGRVLETRSSEGEGLYKYSIYNPNENPTNDVLYRYAIKFNDNQSTNKYKDLIKSEIRQMNEMAAQCISSNTHYVAIHKVQINCYYLDTIGAGGEFALIQKLCKSYSAFSYTGDFNICWFAKQFILNTMDVHRTQRKLIINLFKVKQ